MGAKAPDFKPGETLPGSKYRIVKQIGAGGMGVVYQVVKPPEIQGVLKLMSTDLTAHQEFRTRFFDEVRVLAQLDHPNIVKVFDYDSLTDGTPYYVMELLHGRTVRDVLSTMGTIPPRVAFEITRQLCEALHAAHTHDIPVVHRDIKPENIFLHAPRHGEPVVKLIDFGVVAVADRQHDGAFVGTWKYAAPEQIRGERATAATDLYAVGLVLYEMLCGGGPFEHLESGSLVSQAHLRELPPPVSRFAPWVPPSVVKLIDAALAKEPRQRPRDAYAFAEQLYELEWANDGRDPNNRTAEGPLSRILSTVGAAKRDSKNMVAAATRDRLGNVPVIGIPPEARHDGGTIKGVGGQGNESTVPPGEDTLLAGLLDRAEHAPASNKRASRARAEELGAPPTQEAARTGSLSELATQKRGAKVDTDTFASQESDAQLAPRSRNGLVIAAVVVIVLIGVGSFALSRTRPAPVVAAPPEAPVIASAVGAVVAPSSVPSASSAPVAASSAVATASAKPARARPTGRPAARPDVAPDGSLVPSPTPQGVRQDESFTHAF